jgi:hypothetical protein
LYSTTTCALNVFYRLTLSQLVSSASPRRVSRRSTGNTKSSTLSSVQPVRLPPSPPAAHSDRVLDTGYDTTFHYPFPIIGRSGLDIRARWTPHPETYLSICVDGFPNWFFSLGPNAGVGSGSLLALIEQQVEYAVAAGMKMQRERLKSVEIRAGAVRDYDEYIEVRSSQTLKLSNVKAEADSCFVQHYFPTVRLYHEVSLCLR